MMFPQLLKNTVSRASPKQPLAPAVTRTKPHVTIDNYTSLSLPLLRSALWLSFIPVANHVSCLQQNTFLWGKKTQFALGY